MVFATRNEAVWVFLENLGRQSGSGVEINDPKMNPLRDLRLELLYLIQPFTCIWVDDDGQCLEPTTDFQAL